MLRRLRCSEDQCWGAGVLIFAPKRRKDSKRGLKCRYTPVLTLHTKFDSFPLESKLLSECKKESCCERTKAAVSKWIEISQGVGDSHDRALCAYIFRNKLPYGNLTELTERITESLSKEGQNFKNSEIRTSLKRACSAGLLEQQQKEKKRKNGSVVTDYKFNLWN